MTSSHSLFRCGSGAVFCAVLACVSALRAEDALPRYQLTPGQKLVYRETAESTQDGKPQSKTEHDITLVVLEKLASGDSRLLVREVSTYTTFRPDKPDPVSHTMSRDGYLDVAPDGKLGEAGLPLMARVTNVFPPLPADAGAAKGSWNSKLASEDTLRNCRAGDNSGSGPWHFAEDPQTLFQKLYGYSIHRDYNFDREKGLVTRASTLTKEKDAKDEANSKPVVMELVSSTQLEPAELKTLAADANRYIAAQAESQKLAERGEQDFAHTGELFDQAEALLKALDGQIEHPLIREMLTAKHKELEGGRRGAIEEAERFGKLINQPSANWKTTDLDGSPRSLEDYKGKVVVLDFWYKNCGWCIRAMPQINELVDDFRGQDVVILGMNNDRKVEDARLVIDLLKLKYVSLKNTIDDKHINSDYGIRGWPTLVVLDGKGVIRHIHVGYTPNLRAQLTTKIRELLAERGS